MFCRHIALAIKLKENWKSAGWWNVFGFNAFNKEYSTNLRFPILFEFNGERYVPAEHFPKSVTLNVSGIGWDLFRRRIGVKVPQLIIPLDRPAEIKKIVASALIPVMATQIGNLKLILW